MICCRCNAEMFTASMVQTEKLSEDLVFKHAAVHHECGNCGVTYNIFIPALNVTKILRLKKGQQNVRNTCCLRRVLPWNLVREETVRPTKECPACGGVVSMTSHHIFPVRHYGRKNNNHVLLLCRSCHSQLERYIPYAAMPRDFYNAIVIVFLRHLCKRARAKAVHDFFDGSQAYQSKRAAQIT